MIFSREALLWAFIYYGPLANAEEGIPFQLERRSFVNSTLTTASQQYYNAPIDVQGGRSLMMTTSSVPDTSQSSVPDTSQPPGRHGVTFSIPTSSSSSSNNGLPPTVPGGTNTAPAINNATGIPTPTPTSISSFLTSSGSRNSSARVTTLSGSHTYSRYNTSSWQQPTTRPSSTRHRTTCLELGPTDEVTVYSIVPNPTTITITTSANMTMSFTTLPEFTPPSYCPTASPAGPTSPAGTISVSFPGQPASSAPESSATLTQTVVASSTRKTTTVLSTNKNPQTVFVPPPDNNYPGISTDKSQILQPPPTTTPEWGAVGPPGSGDMGTSLIPFSTSNGGVPPGNTAPPGTLPTDNNHPATTAGGGGGNPGSPGNYPPGNNSPSNNPPSNNPPSNNPPSNNPPSNNPPSNNPPSNNLPGNNQQANPGNGGGGGGGGGGAGTGPITTSIGTVPVIIGPTNVIIGNAGQPGGQTTVAVPPATGGNGNGNGNGNGPSNNPGGGGASAVAPNGGGPGGAPQQTGSGGGGGGGGPGPSGGGSPVVVTQDGQVFTINPSQVIGGGTTLNIPTGASAISGGIFASAPAPTSTTISGVPVQLSPLYAVISGTTYSIGAGAPETTITANGQIITVGPEGLVFASTTVAPPATEPTNIVLINPEIFSVIGPSIAVIEGTTFTYGPGIAVKTDVIDGDTITIGPSGISFDGTTLGGTAHPSGTQLGLAGGLSVTEVGSTLAVISGMTFTIGPGATPSTTIVNGHTITIGSAGLGVEGTTLSYPFNPTTEIITAGGITFSEIGPSLVVIGGTTFTVGPGASPTTDIYNGQTISIGPGGVGFATTTVPPLTSTPTSTISASATGKKKNAAGRLRSEYGVLGTCIAVCMLYMI